MRIAQELYEEGYITYMRTDSPILSTQAKEIATKLVIDNFGSEYLQDGGGRKDGHSRKDKKAPLNAQEAHEAIRPVEWSGTFKTPEETGLDGKKKALYSLVYKRCIASMMTKAELLTKTYSISNGNDSHEDQVVFKTSETDTLFPGFQAGIDMLDDGTRNHVAEANKQKFGKKERVTQGQRVWLTNAIQNTDSMGTNDALAAPETGGEDEDDGDNDNDDVAIVIEEDQKDQKDILLMEGLTGVPHKTRPPSRFSESSFIKVCIFFLFPLPSHFAPLFLGNVLTSFLTIVYLDSYVYMDSLQLSFAIFSSHDL
jgi:DNA topoisomerase IA